VNHGEKEYVRYEGERMIGTNTVEGFYSIFKRRMKGIYQHCAEHHLHRYLSEYDFRLTPRQARLRRQGPHRRCDQGRGRQAAYLPATSSNLISRDRHSASLNGESGASAIRPTR
jgi:hypothetical protein